MFACTDNVLAYFQVLIGPIQSCTDFMVIVWLVAIATYTYILMYYIELYYV